VAERTTTLAVILKDGASKGMRELNKTARTLEKTAGKLNAPFDAAAKGFAIAAGAAVVVGGTSLSGGEGRMLGTLTGAFTIAVIQNGMNLTNVESYTQKVVLGLVILGAVLLDKLRQAR
jgi:ribose/xylose/arabinose/galactoside ABC-type transport system permease subunit